MSFYFQKEISLTSDSFLIDENGDIIYPDYFPIGLNGLKRSRYYTRSNRDNKNRPGKRSHTTRV